MNLLTKNLLIMAEEILSDYLAPIGKVPQIGEEKLVYSDGNIRVLENGHGSSRLMLCNEYGEYVSCLQFVWLPSAKAIEITTIVTKKEYRRIGCARFLLDFLTTRFAATVLVSDLRSEDGDAFINAYLGFNNEEEHPILPNKYGLSKTHFNWQKVGL